MSLKLLKGIGMGLSIVSGIVSIVADIVGQKQMDAKIVETVAKHFENK